MGITAPMVAGTEVSTGPVFRVYTPKGLDFILRNSPTELRRSDKLRPDMPETLYDLGKSDLASKEMKQFQKIQA